MCARSTGHWFGMRGPRQTLRNSSRPRPMELEELCLDHLARGVTRQRLNDRYMLRDLVARQILPAVPEDFAGFNGLSQDDERRDLLVGPIRGDAYHGSLDDRSVE